MSTSCSTPAPVSRRASSSRSRRPWPKVSISATLPLAAPTRSGRPTIGAMIQMDALVRPIAEKALADGVTIAVAESLTCGALVNALGAGESSSEWLAGGVAAYMMSTKVDVLGVTAGIDPCSAQCAEELAVGVRTLLRADVAMSTTGVGGPDPEDGHEPGT